MTGHEGFSRRTALAAGATMLLGGVAGCSAREGDGAVATSPPTDPATTSILATSPPTTGSPTSTTVEATVTEGYVPVAGEWSTVTAADAGYSEAGLAAVVELVGTSNSDALVILAEGRIVAEQYWREATATTVRDVASVQKSIVSTLVGLARSRGLLVLDDPVSEFLGDGWSNASVVDERIIRLHHLLTMTSGLDPRTLRTAAQPGIVWDYNTDAYQKLRQVLEVVAGTDINSLTLDWLFRTIGITTESPWRSRARAVDATGDELWGLRLTARDMARFGLLAMRNGHWAGEQITEPGWFAEAWTPIPLNANYGYLWWLLGGSGRTGGQGPADLVAALGAQDQKIYVAPSIGLVLVRQGDAAAQVTEAGSDFDAALVSALMRARE
ncbi:MAG: serine hydrolase [Actinomycetota bacterium]|nr:serine hydrolase [Actinomycetota bacterium]